MVCIHYVYYARKIILRGRIIYENQYEKKYENNKED